MLIVNTKGQLCPKPIIETKKVLREIGVGETFVVETNSETTLNNLKRFLSDNNTKFTVEKNEGEWSLEITKLKGELTVSSVEEYCPPEITALVKGDYVIAITSDIMGQGDDELGKKLMKSFLSIVLYLDELPSAIIFYNSGVKLTTKDSSTIEYLCELEKHNVEIIVCGTCVDFFGIGNQLGTGTINDMLTITNRLLKAGKVIRP